MNILPKAVYRFNAIPIKLPMAFFMGLEQIILKFVWKKNPNNQNNLENEEQSWRNHTPWLQNILQSHSHQNRMVLTHTHKKNRRIDKYYKIESPEVSPHTSGQSMTKEARIYNIEKSLFNKWCWEKWTATCKRMKLEHSLALYTKKKKLNMD